jgi:hypothetical protein
MPLCARGMCYGARMGDARDLDDLRRAIEKATDPEERRHLERKLKLADPATRDAFIATLQEPSDDDPFPIPQERARKLLNIAKRQQEESGE